MHFYSLSQIILKLVKETNKCHGDIQAFAGPKSKVNSLRCHQDVKENWKTWFVKKGWMNCFFSLGKTRLREDLIPDFSSLKADTKKWRNTHSPGMQRQQELRVRIFLWKCCLSIKKHNSPCEQLNTGIGCPREVVKSLSMKISKIQLDAVLSN